MSDRLKCAGRLNELLENNFAVAKTFRKMKRCVNEEHLQNFFQQKASRRYQFAIELSEEIGFLKEAYCSYGPFSPSRKNSRVTMGEDIVSLLKVAIRNDKEILQEYKHAMAVINEASTREILIRHMAAMEKSLMELKTLKAVSAAHEKRKFSLQTIKNKENEVY